MAIHLPGRLSLAALALTLAACQSNPVRPDTVAGAEPAGPGCERLSTMTDSQKQLTGAAIGAALGALVTKATGGSKGRHYATGALGGALLGALASSAFKNDIEVEEQADGSVRLKIPGSVMFASGQSALSPGIQSTLTSVTGTVRKYCGVTVRVVGHTDSVGPPAANQQLSERRAAAVQNHMHGQGLERARVAIEGRGSNEPVASNVDEAGRQKNRRVEIFVLPPAG